MTEKANNNETFENHGEPAGGCLRACQSDLRRAFLTGDVTDPQTREEAMMLLRAIYKRG
jgi:hypothetical protein